MTETFTSNLQKVWLFCRRCGDAELLRTPGPELFDQGDREQEIVEFLERHAHHPVTQLASAVPGSTLYSGPLWDPQTIVWIDVTDGQDRFVLEGFRLRLDEPRRYRLRQGVLLHKIISLDFDRDLARRAWNFCFGSTAPRRAVETLLDGAQRLVAQIAPETVEPEFSDHEDPEIALAAWPLAAREALYREGSSLLPVALHDQWQNFLCNQCSAHGAWALRLRTQVRLIEAADRLNAPL